MFAPKITAMLATTLEGIIGKAELYVSYPQARHLFGPETYPGFGKRACPVIGYGLSEHLKRFRDAGAVQSTPSDLWVERGYKFFCASP